MTTTDVISPDLKTVLRRLTLSRMLDTLPERLTLARQQKLPHQDLLLHILSDEVSRRDSLAVTLRVQNARRDPTMRLEHGDSTAKVTFDRTLFNELLTKATAAGKRYGRRFAVLFIDLDRFKIINDSLGHEGGDHLLKEMAARFNANVRESDRKVMPSRSSVFSPSATSSTQTVANSL